MKKQIISCMALLMSLGVSAQNETGVADHLGVSVGVGTTGITLDLSTMFTDYVGLRVGADIFPNLKLNTELDLGFDDEAKSAYQNMFNTTLPSEIEVQGKTGLTAGHLLVDVHPFKSSFRVTVGAYIGGQDIVSVYNREDGALKQIADFNGRIDRNEIPSLTKDNKIGLELGDYFLEPDKDGNVDARIRVNGFRPYVGLGFGRAVPKKRLACQFDLGVQFWGSPEIYLRDHKLSEKDLDGDAGGIIKVVSNASVYPSLTVRLVGRIF